MRLADRLMNPSGGLVYHQRALFHAWNLWAPYKRALAAWLRRWPSRAENLLLFGPSGGYTVPAEFLARFRAVHCIDPDPLAACIFRARFGRLLRSRGIRLLWSSTSPLALGPGSTLDVASLARFLDLHPGSSIFFANLIGQGRFLREEDPGSPTWQSWLRGLEAALSGRDWASVHDLASGPAAVDVRLLPSIPPGASAADLQRLFPTLEPDEVVDHSTSAFSIEAARERFVWRLTPEWRHVIDAVSARGF